MADPAQVNPQILDGINATQNATLVPDVILREGSGKAYQSVAQSMAIAVQDATDNLRNVNTMASTAMGVALAQLLATGDPQYLQAIAAAQQVSTTASALMATIGQDAAGVLRSFPYGAT
jgi:predicted component of type VI protein secretion system